MPTYEYVCDVCKHSFDELQGFSEEPLKKCPRCGKNKLRRLFGTGAAVLFKGSGFYETDYRSESYKAAAKAEQDSSKPADAGTKEPAANGKTDTVAATGSGGKGKSKGKPAESPT